MIRRIIFQFIMAYRGCWLLLFCFVAVSASTAEKDVENGVYSFVQDLSQRTGLTKDEVIGNLRQLFSATNVLGLAPRKMFDGCFLCREAMSALFNLYPFGTSDEKILDIVTKGCQLLKIEEPDVCDGAVHTIGVHILYVVNNTDLTVHAPELCSMLTGSLCDTLTGEEWLVQLPDVPKPPVEPVPQPKPGSPTLKVLQIADMHLDPDYVVGSNANCNKPHCCRDPLSNSSDPNDAAGIWGAYSGCDPPTYMMDNLMQHITETHKDIDYILYTGDIPPHDSWQQTREYNKKVMRQGNDFIRKYFKGIPVFPIIGNHDNHPINCFAPWDESLSGNEEFDISWLTEYMWNEWTEEWLPQDLTSKDFFYSIEPFSGLKIIGLNSNYNSNQDWWTYLFNVDPAGQLAWLAKELQESEDKGQKVQILVHHPMGTDARKTYSHNFQRIVNRYESTIRGIFAGHTHYDEFQLLYDSEDQDRAVAVTYVSPSPTPWMDINPSYRLYTIDGDYEGSTYAVLDTETYYMDLQAANSPESNYAPKWEKLYSAKEAYNMESLQPQYWKELVDRMAEDDDTMNLYWEFWHRKSPTLDECDEECRKSRLCFIVTGDAVDYDHCNNI